MVRIVHHKKERESILAYFKKHSIKSITLRGDKLLIEYSNNSNTETKPIDTSELKAIQSYCQALGKNSLSLVDLQKTNTQQPTNYLPWIIGGGIILVLLGIIVYLLLRNKKLPKNKMKSKLPNPQILLKLLQRFTQQELANIYGCNEKTIRRHLRPSNKEKQKRGVKEKITGDNLAFLLSFTSYHSNYNTLTQQEMATRLCQERNILVSQQTISRILIKRNRTRKKITPRYREQKPNQIKQF